MEQKTMSVQEVANALGISRTTAYEVVNRADFPSIRVSPRRIVVPVSEFQKWVEKEAWANTD